MSIYIAVDNHEETSMLASNQGWASFKKWVKSLPMGHALDLRHLCQHGWDQDLDKVAEQLKDATLLKTPDEDVQEIVIRLMSLLKDNTNAKVITIV